MTVRSGQKEGGLAGSQAFLVGALLVGALLGHGGASWPRQHRPAGRSQALVVGAPLVGHGGASWASQIAPQHRSGPQMECRQLLVYDDYYVPWEV